MSENLAKLDKIHLLSWVHTSILKGHYFKTVLGWEICPILFRNYHSCVTDSILLVHACMITRIFHYFIIRNLGTYFSSQTYKWDTTTQNYIFSAACNWSFILKKNMKYSHFYRLNLIKQHLQHVWKLHMWFFCLLNTVSSWRMKDQLDVTCYFISLVMCSTCFGH